MEVGCRAVRGFNFVAGKEAAVETRWKRWRRKKESDGRIDGGCWVSGLCQRIVNLGKLKLIHGWFGCSMIAFEGK